jgi:hypothetical protein
MRNEHRKRKSVPMRPGREAINEAIDEAIQTLVKKGLLVDSGQRKWSERTGRFEVVWESKLYEPVRMKPAAKL